MVLHEVDLTFITIQVVISDFVFESNLDVAKQDSELHHILLN